MISYSSHLAKTIENFQCISSSFLGFPLLYVKDSFHFTFYCSKVKTIIVSIFHSDHHFDSDTWSYRIQLCAEGAKLTKSLTESLARVCLHPILIEKLSFLGSYEHWVGSFRSGFQSVFFACYGIKKERERERESTHTQERKRMEIRERPCETQNWVSSSLCYSQQGTTGQNFESVCKNHWMIVSSTSSPWIHYYYYYDNTRSLLF